LALELNWACDPAENPHIESTLGMWEGLAAEFPFLMEHWRFVQCLFRAKLDAYCRRRRIQEQRLVDAAKPALERGDSGKARAVLHTPLDAACTELRAEIEQLAALLFRQIGLQTDVERYGAKSWERGAVLMTMDLPITDRQWLLTRLDLAETMPPQEAAAFLRRVLRRNKTGKGEAYFSVAEHGLEALGMPQVHEIYLNFQGDRPNVNNGTLPTCMFQVYDSYSLRCKLGGFEPGRDYKLRVTYQPTEYGDCLNRFSVKANGKTAYEGKPFGGERDEQFDRELVAPGFVTVSYRIPAAFFENGCLELEIGEPVVGVRIAEFWITKL